MEVIKKRNEAIDIAKSIGIILVVLGHTDFVGKSFIYQFHLPLFFFLSGYVFTLKSIENPKEFLLKKIKALYVPFIIFEIIFLIFHNFFVMIGFYNKLSNFTLIYSTKDFFENLVKILTMGYGEQLAGPLWFLISTLEINIVFGLLAYISDKKERKFPIILLISSTIIYFIGCYTNLPRMMSQSCIGLFFYCCGYIYRKYEDKVKYKIYYFLISVSILVICSFFNSVDISQLAIKFKTLLIISGLAGTYGIIFIAKKIRFFKNKFLLYCGQNTIYILALHCLIFKFVMYVEIKLYNENIDFLGIFPVYQKNQLWSLIFTIFGVIIPILLKKIIDKIKEKYICRQNQ